MTTFSSHRFKQLAGILIESYENTSTLIDIDSDDGSGSISGIVHMDPKRVVTWMQQENIDQILAKQILSLLETPIGILKNMWVDEDS